MDGLNGVRYGVEIAQAARRHGIEPFLLAAVAAQETGGPGVDSGANIVGDGGHGHGIFQIDDRFHAFASTPAARDPAASAVERPAATTVSELRKRGRRRGSSFKRRRPADGRSNRSIGHDWST
jgi:hypothetical protein